MLFKPFAAILAATACVRAVPAADPDCDCEDVQDVQNQQQNQGFEVVIVYETPDGGCDAKPTQCQFDQGLGNGHPQIQATASPHEDYHGNGNSNSRQTATFEHNGPMETLKPGIHWDHDSTDQTHLVPVPADQGSHQYYGVTGKNAIL